MSTSTSLAMRIITMHNTISLLEIARIACQVRLSIQPLACIWHLAHPAHLCAIDTQHLQSLALLSQFFGHSFDIDIQVVPQKISDLGVLVVSLESARSFRIRGVDVYVGGAVAVSRPSRLRAARNHIGILVECGCRVFDELGDLVRGGVVDAQTGSYGFADKFGSFVVGGVGLEVCRIGESEVFGGVGCVGEGGRVPDIFGVFRVEFCQMC